ncbi:sulfotransferase [Desulfurobacterium sp.]
MSKSYQQSPIIIIGMHRSGTSLISRILEKCGIFMGKNKDENNEAFFFLNFNYWIFRQANATWDNPYNYTKTSESFKNLMTKLAKKYIRSIRRIEFLGLKQGLKYKSLKEIDFPWGWKDPKNSFTLDIWLKVFPDAKIIHIYRNPIDVAESLRKRTLNEKKKFKWNIKKEIKFFFRTGHLGFGNSERVENIKEGIKLWKEYISNIFKLEKQYNLNMMHVKYENFLENPEKITKDILKELNIDYEIQTVRNAINGINTNRRYAFLKDDNLYQIYKEIQNQPLLTKLNYNKIR